MKRMRKLKEEIRYLLRFPYEEAYRERLELDLIALNFRSERIIAYAMLLLQFFMILVFSLRPGSIFLSFRRLRYVITYAVLFLGLLLFLPLHKRSRKNRRMHANLCLAFAVMLSLWTASLSYLDSLGGVGIVVYCSTLPIMATFLIIPPQILSGLFLATCALTDFLVLITPYGHQNVFSVLINSIFTCLLSTIYAYRVYHTRLASVYNQMVIDQKNEQLENANRELDLLSMTDALTAVGNRRYLDESVKPMLEKYGVYMGSLAVLFLDIDFFKRYNDHYGHCQGDRCLQSVASILSSFAKENDFRAVRYGGEEFLLVMTGLPLDQILAKAEQLRQTIASTPISDSSGRETAITISTGVSFHPTWEPDFLETAIHEADQALYKAKQNGRNRVALFGQS